MLIRTPLYIRKTWGTFQGHKVLLGHNASDLAAVAVCTLCIILTTIGERHRQIRHHVKDLIAVINIRVLCELRIVFPTMAQGNVEAGVLDPTQDFRLDFRNNLGNQFLCHQGGSRLAQVEQLLH